MKKFAFVFGLGVLAGPALADEQEPFYGVWGTEKQCARELITPKGTKLASPFEITPDWLGQGGVWCRLTWIGVDDRGDRARATLGAICGEDAERPYQLTFDLKDEQLSLSWDLFLKNGPLERCEAG